MLTTLLTTPLRTNYRRMIVDAVVERLQGLRRVHGGYLEMLAPFNGTRNAETIIQITGGASPAVLVASTGGRMGQMRSEGKAGAKMLDLELMVISAHYGALVHQMDGGLAFDSEGADPGTYQILQDCEELLFGWAPPICGADRFAPITEDPAAADESFVSWIALYSIRVNAKGRPEEAGAVLEEIHTRHRLAHSDPDAAEPVLYTTTTELRS